MTRPSGRCKGGQLKSNHERTARAKKKILQGMDGSKSNQPPRRREDGSTRCRSHESGTHLGKGETVFVVPRCQRIYIRVSLTGDDGCSRLSEGGCDCSVPVAPPPPSRSSPLSLAACSSASSNTSVVVAPSALRPLISRARPSLVMSLSGAPSSGMRTISGSCCSGSSYLCTQMQ